MVRCYKMSGEFPSIEGVTQGREGAYDVKVAAGARFTKSQC